MSYESEQLTYLKELESLKVEVEYLDGYFTENPNAKFKQLNSFGVLNENVGQRWLYEKILRERYNDGQAGNYSLEYLKFKILCHRKNELEFKISQTKGERRVSKVLNYIDGITPQPVGGRVYQVKDGDGCGTFCLWFMVIDALLCLIVGLCVEGCH